jgi:hypothetical protein
MPTYGSDGTRTRGLRRDRPELIVAGRALRLYERWNELATQPCVGVGLSQRVDAILRAMSEDDRVAMAGGAHPVTALLIATVAVKEGRQS